MPGPRRSCRAGGIDPVVRHRGGAEAGRNFVEALELHSHLANVGDVRSLVIHRPRPPTRSSPRASRRRPVTPDLVRLSVGLESVDDILADLDAGFRAAKS